MGKRNPVIDTYILKSAEFAQPILIHLCELVHIACPDTEEKMKWSFPHFDYLGEMMCSMAAFKYHCSFGFWKAPLLNDPKGFLKETGTDGMGHLGKITSLKDLPSDKVLIQFIRQAMKLNEQGVKLPAKSKSNEKKGIIVPNYFVVALGKNKKAKATFNAFAYSHKKEYVEWITGAKSEETRSRRMATAIEWIAEGKGRNWKYERK